MGTAVTVALISAGATVVAAAIAILPHFWRDKGEVRTPSPPPPPPKGNPKGGSSAPAKAPVVGRIYGLRDAAKLTGGRHDAMTRFQLKSVKGDALTVQAHNRMIDPETGREIDRDFFTVTPEDLVSPPPHSPGSSFVRVCGVSPGAQRAARELDLALEVDEIVLHIHQPGGSQTK